MSVFIDGINFSGNDECNNMLAQKWTEGESLRVTYPMNVGKKYSLSLLNSESH